MTMDKRAEFERVRAEIHKRLATDPVFVQTEANLAVAEACSGGIVLTKPEEALWAQYRLAYSAVIEGESEFWERVPIEARTAWCVTVQDADTYLWDTGIFEAAAMMDVPPHTISADELPQRFTFWCFSNPKDMLQGVPRGEEVVGGIMWMPRDGGGCDVFVICPGIVFTAPLVCTFNDNQRFPEEVENPKSNGQFLSTLAFLRSKSLEAQSTKVSRALRRKAIRDGHKEPPLVKVVKLRRSAGHRRPGEDSRSYTKRWLVSGHMRNQWYEKQQRHRLIYIEPYVKGPDGAPLMSPRRTVNVVDR